MKSVIFTSLKPEIWQYRVAYSLRKKGIKTTSISLQSFDRDFFKDAFDEVINFNSENLKPKTVLKSFFKSPFEKLLFIPRVLRTKADVAICHGAPFYLSAIFIHLFKNKMKTIFFPYDVNSADYVDPEKYLPKKEIWGEEYSFENCDGILCKNDVTQLDLLPERINIKGKPAINMHSYTLEKWYKPYIKKEKLSSKDHEVHVVYAGGYAIQSRGQTPVQEEIAKVVQQKIHYHFYPSTNNYIPKEHIDFITKNGKYKKYFHYYDTISGHWVDELTKYDFGIHPTKSTKVSRDGGKYVGASKIANYLEAGLPLIVAEEATMYSGDVKKYKTGIASDDYTTLKKEIDKLDYNKTLKNVEKYRKIYSFENHVNDLIEFADKIKKR